jgi:ribonuclease T1
LKTTFFKRWLFLLITLLFFGVLQAKEPASKPTDQVISEVMLSALPPEARQTLGLIKQGGPYPYAKDGAVFGNYEGLLPRQKRGYYHEFTVKTPRARNRGARRIVSGGNPQTSDEYYYTKDHYQTFQRIRQ